MGDLACLMQPFCYASGIPSEPNESNPIHSHGQSVSFGRFMPESLAWEKWSTFSHNRYVEEAERYSRPGSVAQKKAFFEAHYKKLAAQKAAALLEQANNATKQEHEAVVDNTHNSQTTSSQSKLVVNEEGAKVLNSEPNAMLRTTGHDSNSNIEATISNSSKVEGAFAGNSMWVELQNQREDVDTLKKLSEKASGMPLMDIPIPKLLQKVSNSDQEVLQSMGKKKPAVSSFKLLKAFGTCKFTSKPVKNAAPIFSDKDNITSPMNNEPVLSSADKKRSTPKSHCTPVNRLTASVMRKFESTRVGTASSMASKDSLTPLSTPTMASKNEMQKHSFTEKKSLKTEERAARIKKKLEDKYNANDAEKVQLHSKLKKKAETKIRKLRHSFCFKASPLPDFSKERKALKNETKKDALRQSESPKQGRRPTPRVVESKTSVSPQRPSLKNNGAKNFPRNNGRILIHPPASNSMIITTYENISPNIPHGNQNDKSYR